MKRKGVKKGRKWPIWAGTGLLLAVLAAGAVYLKFPSRNRKAEAAAPVLSVNASLGSLSAEIVGSGHLQSAEAQEISVPAGLSIETIAVEVGDTVSAGDVLATINETALTAEIA